MQITKMFFSQWNEDALRRVRKMECFEKNEEIGDLETSPRSALIRSQREGQVYLDSLGTMTKLEWKLRNFNVKVKFSTTRRGTVLWF